MQHAEEQQVEIQEKSFQPVAKEINGSSKKNKHIHLDGNSLRRAGGSVRRRLPEEVIPTEDLCGQTKDQEKNNIKLISLCFLPPRLAQERLAANS